MVLSTPQSFGSGLSTFMDMFLCVGIPCQQRKQKTRASFSLAIHSESGLYGFVIVRTLS
jgi:hypothetical protein